MRKGNFDLRKMEAFLCGEASLDGVWFGDKHPTERGEFWWRRHLKKSLEINENVMRHIRSEQGWMPIESAPKNQQESEIYILGRMGIIVCTMAWCVEEEVWYTFNAIWEAHCRTYKEHEYAQKGWQPTHWMPLPIPPTKVNESE